MTQGKGAEVNSDAGGRGTRCGDVAKDIALVIPLVAVLLAARLAASVQQAPPAVQQPPPQKPPATQPAPAARPAPLTLTIQVTDAVGAVLGDVQVRATGPVEREGRTSDEGTLKFANLKPGTYRLRFVREGYFTLERDVALRAGQPLQIEVTLSEAPPPMPPPPSPPPEKPPEPPPPPPPPVAEPKTVAIPSFVELNFIGARATRKDSLIACAGTGTATLVQLREPLADEVHDATDEWLYVIAGEGTLQVGEREEKLAAGTFSLVPRTVRHTIVPRGRNPLILIAIQTGTPCRM